MTSSGNNPRHIENTSTPVFAGEVLGYARVSTTEQNMDRQIDALQEAGCTRVFMDQGVSGATWQRPGLDELLAYARRGDVIVVQALDRLGRTLRELLALMDDLEQHGIGLRILTLGVDTTTPAGRVICSIIGSLAAFERDILRQRTLDGLAAARARGRVGGRPPSLTQEQVQIAREWGASGRSAAEIARLLGTSDRTIRRHLAASV